jgi:hypothetical protein
MYTSSALGYVHSYVVHFFFKFRKKFSYFRQVLFINSKIWDWNKFMTLVLSEYFIYLSETVFWTKPITKLVNLSIPAEIDHLLHKLLRTSSLYFILILSTKNWMLNVSTRVTLFSGIVSKCKLCKLIRKKFFTSLDVVQCYVMD